MLDSDIFRVPHGKAIRQCMIRDNVEGKDPSEPGIAKERQSDADRLEVQIDGSYLFFSILV